MRLLLWFDEQSEKLALDVEHAHACMSYYMRNISRTSAVSSTNFRSTLIFASCVVGTYCGSINWETILIQKHQPIPTINTTAVHYFVFITRAPHAFAGTHASGRAGKHFELFDSIPVPGI